MHVHINLLIAIKFPLPNLKREEKPYTIMHEITKESKSLKATAKQKKAKRRY